MDMRTVKTATYILDKNAKNKKDEDRLQKNETNIEKILQLLQNINNSTC